MKGIEKLVGGQDKEIKQEKDNRVAIWREKGNSLGREPKGKRSIP